MKYSLLTVLLALMLQACHKEAALTPTPLASITSKFAFPQGASPADDLIQEVYAKCGVKLIYKSFTQGDVDRTWKSPEGDSFISERCEWSYLDESTELETAISLLKEKVFDLLPADVIKAGLRTCLYLYVVNDIHYAEGSKFRMPVYPAKGLDSRMVDAAVDYHRRTENYSMRVFYPARILCEIFVSAYAEGAITMPREFFEGFEAPRVGELKSRSVAAAGRGTPDYDNFWARRGFPPFISTLGRIATSPLVVSCAINNSVMPPLTEATREISPFFLFLCLDTHWKEYFRAGNIFEDCPKLEGRLNMFNDRMRDVYGINFDAIREKLYEDAGMDMAPDRYAPKNSEDFSFIYE
jgi:hypothetical protein